MSEQIIIDQRFCGPPNSGNGGYSCGILAKHIAGASEVTLRKPPPLNTPMQIQQEGDKLVLLKDNTLIAEAKPGILELEIPIPPSFAEVEVATKNYLAYTYQHPFPTCFVCGLDRPHADGLSIYAGKVADRDLFAAPWIPAADLADEEGKIRKEYIWAALDCPGAYAAMGDQIKTIVLGRMTAQVYQRPRPGEACTVTAWLLGEEGRKSFVGTAVYNAKQELCAAGKAIWFEIDA